MMGISNLGTTPKALTALSQGAETTKPAAQDALASFSAFLAQVMAGDTPEDTAADGKVTGLAEMLGKFRAEAQESLAEVFPDGVIVPGPEFNDWAKQMLSKLDGLMQGLGADLGDLAQVLAPLEAVGGLTGSEGGTLLQQAVAALVGDVSPGAPVAKAMSAPTAVVARPEAGQLQAVPGGPVSAEVSVGAVSTDVPVGTTSTDVPDGTGTVDATGQGALAGVEIGADANDGDSVAAAVTSAAQSATAETLAGVGDLASDVPLPEPLRALLAQVMAAPADRTLPPEVQAILSTPQQAVAPVAPVAAVAPAPAPQSGSAPQNNGFARNLVGQIRGVSFTEGTTRIELTPQGLGKLEIEIAPDEAGKLRVVIRAENPAVLNAMRSDREMLAGLLRDSGTSVDDGAMSFEGFEQRGGTRSRGETGGTVTATGPVEDEEQVADPAPMVEDGRLNILT